MRSFLRTAVEKYKTFLCLNNYYKTIPININNPQSLQNITLINKNMNTPIIFVHKSNSYYLYAALLKAHMTNPNRVIILIGDKTNDKYSF